MKEKEFLAQLERVLMAYDELEKQIGITDQMCEEQPLEQAETDKLLSDYYHILETEDVSETNMIKIAKLIHNERLTRRSQGYCASLINTYKKNKLKLQISPKSNREMFRQEIKKTCNGFYEEYNYRVLTDEQIKELTEDKHPDKKDKLKKLYDSGLTQKEIAKEMNTTQPQISVWLRKFGFR